MGNRYLFILPASSGRDGQYRIGPPFPCLGQGEEDNHEIEDHLGVKVVVLDPEPVVSMFDDDMGLLRFTFSGIDPDERLKTGATQNPGSPILVKILLRDLYTPGNSRENFIHGTCE
jgi:hypothetical protein